MPRKYTKKNLAYWEPGTSQQANMPEARQYTAEEMDMLKPKLVGTEVKGSFDPQANTRWQLFNGSAGWNGPQFRFPNIYQGILPYQSTQSWIGLADAIELVQKACANIAVVGNAIEAQVEFSCSNIHLKCKNKAAKKACEAWLKRVNEREFQEKFYREYYRSGNVFIYRVYGKIKPALMQELNTKFGYEINKKGEIVVGYIILNPVNVAVKNGGIGLYQSYVKFLTSLELNSLKNSEFGLEMLKQLGIDNKEISDATTPHIYLEFDSSRIVPIFNRKQDYEPLAVPQLWSLLDDLEIKLKMKRADESILITVEDVILLITHGAKKEDGGMNPLNHMALTEMFGSKKTNRVLVADYTTKASFVIPDFSMILGKEKYEQVDKDIKEGLQVIFIGGQGDKFSNQMTQLKMFLKKLEGGRTRFTNFISEELERFCESMGFRNIPTVELKEIDLDDPVQSKKLVAQLMQLGLLTSEEGFKTMQDGIYPSPEDSEESQKKYKKMRDEGLYLPLNPNGMGGSNLQAGKPQGAPSPQTVKKKSPVVGEENNEQEADLISVKGTVQIMRKVGELYSIAEDKLRNEHKKDIKKDDSLIKELVLSTIYNSEYAHWEDNVKRAINTNFDVIASNKEINDEIENLSKELELDKYTATVVRASRKLNV